ncbi:PTS sugar transporter subunit IIC [Bifidobacterium sp. LC6]|uniref:Permease IIC component n=1 Tax=Bifidobacterium colobi TaxID=2809026 RepID=A0ABS5UUE3_9BIFI|nr:PTS sugar transporter subunit IIC [Bifidobacterium colobi]MBT1174696.1 PTS sugar transporter subunit IIC [Bifidobacterium colobi]
MREFGNKLLNGFMKFATTKAVTALKDGFVLTMPATLVGSLFLLLANLPFEGYTDFMNNLLTDKWNIGLNQVSAGTFNILAIVIAVGIGYAYARNEKEDGISSGLLALVAFFILSPSSVSIDHSTVDALKEGTTASVSGAISTSWTGGNGVITAIIVGLLSGLVFVKCMKHNLKIKLPDSVPEGVSNAFSAMIPGFFVVLGSAVIYHLCQVFGGVSFTELIFKILQTPMQNLTDNWAGAIIITLLISVLFWCGIHGPNVVMGIMAPLLTANSVANQALMDAGKAVNTADGGHILTPQIVDCFVKFGGTGITLGLLIAGLIVAKSSQMKGMSKLSIVPGLFNINEPVIFGLPIVFNPFFLIPFIVVPLIAMIITYGAMYIGFMPPFGAVQVPWTTPVIISGFLLGGWKGALIQLIILVISVVVYLPFVKKQDQAWVAEQAANDADLQTAAEAAKA